jgi:membrane protein
MSERPMAEGEPDQLPDEPTPPAQDDPNPTVDTSATHQTLRARMDALKVRADSAKQTLQDRGDQLRARSAAARLAYEAYEDDRRQAGSLLAGGLAYRLFLWLLPTTLLVVTVIGLIVDVSGREPDAVAKDAGLGAALAATVSQAVESSNRATIPLLLLGAWLTIWAGRSVVKAVRLSASVLWGLEPGPLRASTVASLSFTAIVIGLAFLPPLLRSASDVSFGLRVIAELAMLGGMTLLAWWTQTLLPHQPLSSRRALLPGAILFAIGIDLMRLFTQIYLADRLGRVDDLYGSIGFATVFMAWLYLAGRLVVAAIALNATRWRRGQREADEASPTPPALS